MLSIKKKLLPSSHLPATSYTPAVPVTPRPIDFYVITYILQYSCDIFIAVFIYSEVGDFVLSVFGVRAYTF